jgi:hypothetical protein
LKNSDKSWDEKSKKFEEIKNKYEKERKNIKLKKAALTIGIGAGAGLLTGLSEQITGRPNLESPPTPKPPTAITEGELRTINAKIYAKNSLNVPPTEEIKIFDNPDNLEHIKVEGKVNSFWKVVGKGLEENEQFKGLDEAQKQNVISYFTNKAIDDGPEKYGLTPDENFGVRVEIDKEVNLKSLLGDAEEVKKVLNRAGALSEDQQREILERSKNIADYLEKHPDEALDQSKVSEILGGEPEAMEVETETPETPEVPEAPKIPEVKPEPEVAPEPAPKPVSENVPLKTPKETLDQLRKKAI